MKIGNNELRLFDNYQYLTRIIFTKKQRALIQSPLPIVVKYSHRLHYPLVSCRLAYDKGQYPLYPVLYPQ
jgi:hypothetical protein